MAFLDFTEIYVAVVPQFLSFSLSFLWPIICLVCLVYDYQYKCRGLHWQAAGYFLRVVFFNSNNKKLDINTRHFADWWVISYKPIIDDSPSCPWTVNPSTTCPGSHWRTCPSLWPSGIGSRLGRNRLWVRFLAVSDIYPMFIEPTITWVPLGFSEYIWLDTKIVFKKSEVSALYLENCANACWIYMFLSNQPFISKPPGVP